MLFQPTNISPDVINGVSNGTIDVSTGLSVRWQVNGNTPMLGYQIFIYQNTAASPVAFNSGFMDCSSNPIYGVDYQGNYVPYSIFFSLQEITTDPYSVTNGNQYKMMLRQWYGTGDNDYIDQRSLSVFYTKARPVTGVTAVDGNNASVSTTLPTRNATFTGTYTQEQGDPIDYVQWVVYGKDADDEAAEYVELYDTGKIYGTSELKLNYDGFLNGYSYRVKMWVQSASGIVSTASKTFTASWNVSDLPSVCEVCKLNNQSTAMQIRWEGFKYILGIPTGEYSIANGLLNLPAGSSVTWNAESGSALSISSPWAIKLQTELQKEDMSISIRTSSTTVSLNYTMSSRQLSYSMGSSSGTIGQAVPYDTLIQVIITSERIYLNYYKETGGLVPSTSLVPSETLVPKDPTGVTVLSFSTTVSYTQGNINQIVTNGIQNVDYIQIINNYTEDELSRLTAVNMNYDPSEDMIDSTYFLVTFSDNTLDAGTMKIAGTTLEGWAIYRRNEMEEMAVHLVDVPVSTYQVLDYGCGSQEGSYHYDIYPIGGQKYLTSPVRTRSFSPCFENWSVIEATYDKNKGYYRVINEFIFGKNLSSGSISNNNTPTVYKNFTRYATVLKARPNYQSGTLSSLIGYVGYVSYTVQAGDTLEKISVRFRTTMEQIINDNEDVSFSSDLRAGMVIKVFLTNNAWQYFDDKKLRDAIWNLSTTDNTLFLKSRKGDVMRIAPSQDISMSYMDNTKEQATSASFPWVQIGDATNERIIGSIL